MKSTRFSARQMVFTAVMAALICIAAPFVIPLPSAVPLSVATFAVYMAGALLGKEKGTLAVLIYLLIGLVGLPVFSGFTGGIARLAAPTGGYLVGYISCAFLTGLFADKFGGKLWSMAAGMVLGTLSLYLFGTIWFVISTGADVWSALLACVVPFLPLDGVKIAAACAVSVPLRKKLLFLNTRSE